MDSGSDSFPESHSGASEVVCGHILERESSRSDASQGSQEAYQVKGYMSLETIHISQIDPGPLMGNHSFNQLACVARDPSHPMREVIPCACSECGTAITAMRLFSQVTACDKCRQQYEREELTRRHRDYWMDLCPPAFQKTDVTRADFPARAQYDLLRKWKGEESLLLYGDTRTGKTRLAMVLLKRCLHANKYVGVLWPEQLKGMKYDREPARAVAKWGRYDILLLDDALLSAAPNDIVCDLLKDIIDYRMRHEKITIITSQIGGDDVKAQAAKFQELKAGDVARLDALNARIRQHFRVIAFVAQPPAPSPTHETTDTFADIFP